LAAAPRYENILAVFGVIIAFGGPDEADAAGSGPRVQVFVAALAFRVMCVFVVAAVHATTQVRLIRRSPVLAVRATVGSCTRASASDLAARIASAAPASSEGKVFEPGATAVDAATRAPSLWDDHQAGFGPDRDQHRESLGREAAHLDARDETITPSFTMSIGCCKRLGGGFMRLFYEDLEG